MARDQPQPPQRSETLRSALREALHGRELTIRELSQALGATERELLDHLRHLERSLTRTSERLVVEPAYCLGCGFRFDDRTRLSKPGRCPACKSTRIGSPRFGIAAT